ncbi:hypothetical protein B296_00023527, partial [Ensete ventricosum]
WVEQKLLLDSESEYGCIGLGDQDQEVSTDAAIGEVTGVEVTVRPGQGHAVVHSKGALQEKESNGGEGTSVARREGLVVATEEGKGEGGGRKRRSEDCSIRSRGYFVSVALQKKMLATLKGHERLRSAAVMVVVAERDMGCDYKE